MSGRGGKGLTLRLMRYARPHLWLLTVCVALAFGIVAADLVRPYLIKTAIDEHIGGYRKPMLSLPADRAEEFRGFGEPVVAGGRAYVRISAGGAQSDEAAWPDGAVPCRIVEADGRAWLVERLPPGASPVRVERGEDGRAYAVLSDGRRLSAFEADIALLDALKRRDAAGFVTVGAQFLVAVLIGAALSYVQNVELQRTGQRILQVIRQQLFDHLSRLPVAYYDRHPVGRIVVRVTQDTEALNQLYFQVIVHLVKDVLVLVGIVAVMLHMSVRLSLLSFAVLPLLLAMTLAYRSFVRQAQRRMRTVLARLNAFLAENLSGMKTIQLFVRERLQAEAFERHSEDFYRAGMWNTIVNSVFQPAIGFLGNAAVAALVWYGGVQVLDGSATFGVVYAFTHYVRQFFQPLMSLAEKYNQIQTAMVGAERIFETLDTPVTVADPPKPKSLPRPVRGQIEFEGVWFAYRDDEWVLKDIRFRVEPGETVAIVGASGAGKSSVLQLINRFYDIQRGRILLDGIDIRDLKTADLRRAIGVVQQDVFLFAGDLLFNVTLGDPSITEEQAIEAVRAVGLAPFVERLTQKYATPLGERGVNLSAGQRQLLAIARAIAFQPAILVFDEATSNIDTETERLVQQAIARASRGRTTLIVAHRLSTIRNADRIIVMRGGRIVEIGDHAQLMSKNGYYAQLVRASETGYARGAAAGVVGGRKRNEGSKV